MSTITDAKNEYSITLINIIAPLIIEGIKSIFKEALELCIQNEEKDKYLMTFQNFLTRIPNWNQNIIKNESERIIKKSECTYLEDLITCVHISQLKILTSIRVSSKQKKINIDIPKLDNFIHNIYIKYARKIYSNVYLFDITVSSLQIQKNNRELELICKEEILNTIRENIPIDKILNSYMDETNEEEVVLEEKIIDISSNINKNKKEVENDSEKDNEKENDTQKNNNDLEKENDTQKNNNDLEKENDTQKNNNDLENENDTQKNNNDLENENDIDNIIKVKKNEDKNDIDNIIKVKKNEDKNDTNIKLDFEKKKNSSLSFNNDDTIINFNTNDLINTNLSKEIIKVPKTFDSLELISEKNHQKRKEEEENDDENFFDDSDDEKLKINYNSKPINSIELDIETL